MGILASATLPPEEQSTKSTPSVRRLRANSTACSISQPPSTQSVDEMRINSGNRSGQKRRTLPTTSRTIRVRFSKEPPYRSERRVAKRERETRGEKNRAGGGVRRGQTHARGRGGAV